MRLLRELLAAVQLLARLPVPTYRFEPEMTMGSAKLFPHRRRADWAGSGGSVRTC